MLKKTEALSVSEKKRHMLDFIWKFLLLGFILVMTGAQIIVSPIIVSSPQMFFDYISKMIMGVVSLGLVAGALSLIVITGNLDLSLGSIITASSMVACNLTNRALYDINPGLWIALALVVPILVGGRFGLINGLLIGKLKLSPFITPLGTQFVVI